MSDLTRVQYKQMAEKAKEKFLAQKNRLLKLEANVRL